MSQTKCPSCGISFENGRHASCEDLRGRLTFGPERLIVNSQVTARDLDTCPSCGKAFVSDPFLLFGQFVRARLHTMGAVYALVFALAVGVVLVALFRDS
jgi:predicted RNA-binding Zn-ribbon protein involved in translation (DUF1610 family)